MTSQIHHGVKQQQYNIKRVEEISKGVIITNRKECYLILYQKFQSQLKLPKLLKHSGLLLQSHHERCGYLDVSAR